MYIILESILYPDRPSHTYKNRKKNNNIYTHACIKLHILYIQTELRSFHCINLFQQKYIELRKCNLIFKLYSFYKTLSFLLNHPREKYEIHKSISWAETKKRKKIIIKINK